MKPFFTRVGFPNPPSACGGLAPLVTLLACAALLISCGQPSPPETGSPTIAEDDGRLFYVAADGKGRPGNLPVEATFSTISEAVAQLLPGDTLMVAPGVYHEEVVLPPGGDRTRPIILRSQFPGWAELRGSVSVSAWERVPGWNFVFRAEMPRPTAMVVELNTDTFYREVANLRMVEATPGSFLFDAEKSALFVHPTDSATMAHHAVEASVLERGISGREPVPFGSRSPRFTGWMIEGFVVSGYSRHGIYLPNADHSEVRDCIVHHCRRGIFFFNAFRSVIRGCQVRATADPFNREMGNIGIMGYIADCDLEDNIVSDTEDHGIRFYGGHYGVRMRNNLAFRCRIGLQLKGQAFNLDQAKHYLRDFEGIEDLKDDLPNLIEGNVVHQTTGSTGLIAHLSVYRRNTGIPAHSANARKKELNLELHAEEVGAARFADPAQNDLRLQSDSPWRGAGPGGQDLGALPYDGSVFYAGPDGDDNAEGTSVNRAWATLEKAVARLQAGQTLYLLPGRYHTAIRLKGLRAERDRPTRIRAHAHGDVVIDGADKLHAGVVVEDCSYVSLEGLRIQSTQGAGIRIRASDHVLVRENCVHNNWGDGIEIGSGTANVHVLSNVIVDNRAAGLRLAADAVRLRLLGVTLRGNAVQLHAPDGLPDLWQSDANNLGGGTIARLAGEEIGTLSEWRDTSAMDARSGDFDPGFVDAAAWDFALRHDSLSRGRGYLGTPVGTSKVSAIGEPDLRFTGVEVLDVRPDSVDLAWDTPARDTTRLVVYGTDPDRLGQTVIRDLAFHFGREHSMTLHGLEPGRQYYFRIGDRRLLGGTHPFHSYRYKWPERGPALQQQEYDALEKADTLDAGVRSFVTPEKIRVAPRIFHVSPQGDDAADGGEARPWKTLGKACETVVAGDRVLVHEGVYPETIRPLRSGAPGLPITFEAAPGASVRIDGARELIGQGVELVDKRHITIRGFTFFGQRERGLFHEDNGQVLIVDGHDILVEECVFDGRMNYVTSLRIHRGGDILARDNVFISHHHAIEAADNTGVLDIDHNTFLGPTEKAIYAVRNHTIRITNNLINECLFPKKKLQYRISVIGNREVFLDHNCFVFDPENDERRMVDYGAPSVVLEEMTGLPEQMTGVSGRFGAKGDLRQWRERFGQDRNSLVVESDPGWANPERIREIRSRRRGWPDRHFEYTPIPRDELELRPDSRLFGAGESGTVIGARRQRSEDVRR